MNLSEQIVAKQAELVAARDTLVDLTQSMEDVVAIEETTKSVEKLTGELDRLKAAEAAIQKSVARASESPAIVSNAVRLKDSEKADLLVKAAAATFEAYIRRVPVGMILEERFGGDENVKAVASVVTKAAQNPAMTSVQGYAQELVRDSYGAFMDLLQGESVIPRLPLQRFDFGGAANIKIPARASTPNLAGAFRAEGAPIRVGAIGLTSHTLTPKSLGVIGHFTNELFERSTPNILEVIRNAMIQDTAQALDSAFLGSTAGSTTVPAGLQTYATGGNTAASAGGTAANIMADIRGRIQAMTALNMGRRPVWVMNPKNWYGVKLSITAAGTPVFPEAASNQLMGIPVITSTHVPATIVYLIDAAEVAFAGDAPRFMGSDVAVIHEEDTTPLPIVDGTPTAAGPVRSLFQTNSQSLRTIWTIDWAVLRPGAVQTITAVNAW